MSPPSEPRLTGAVFLGTATGNRSRKSRLCSGTEQSQVTLSDMSDRTTGEGQARPEHGDSPGIIWRARESPLQSALERRYARRR